MLNNKKSSKNLIIFKCSEQHGGGNGLTGFLMIERQYTSSIQIKLSHCLILMNVPTNVTFYVPHSLETELLENNP